MAAPTDVETTDLVIRDDTRSIAAFASESNFAAAQRMAIALSRSTMVPKEYQGDVANCLVAMELAGRTGASVMAIMQNVHVINGRPSWSAAFLIGSVNQCGRFSPIRYQLEGEASKNGWRCRAIAKDLASGEVLEGVWVTWEMAMAEGWVTKDRSKWKTMAEQMIRYRAASFWTRIYAPDISLGMGTADEAEDIGPSIPRRAASATIELNDALADDVVIESAANNTATVKAVVVEPPAPAPVEPPVVKKKGTFASTAVPGMCRTCFRTDGSHDPNAPCFEG